MGSCMSSSAGAATASDPPSSKSKKKTKAFQGTGNRLGSSNDPSSAKTQGINTKATEALPKPRVDPSLTQSERDRQRQARLDAAEKRQKENNPKPKKKKAYTQSQQPLRGPNSEPLMRWTAS